jgi:hypothetical protein
LIDVEDVDLPTESAEPSAREVLRLIGTIAVFVILAIVLLGAIAPPAGCGGG